MANDFKINPKTVNLTFQTIYERVLLGFELQESIAEVLRKDEITKYNDAIILSPDYQREYRSTVSDESSLIESALLGIPIPPIFLASHKLKGVPVLNVVDGQHRLRAFHRFFKGDFKLSDLKILKDYEGKGFQDLEIDDMTALQSGDIATITFRDFPGDDFELEIFNRYNQGTKPLTAQEIRHAVFNSSINSYVNNFCKQLVEQPKSVLAKAYAISKDRYQKKTCHENVFVILSILESGVTQVIYDERGREQKIVKSPQFADSYMQKMARLEKESEEDFLNVHTSAVSLFSAFNFLIEALAQIIEYPFSREIYGVAKGGNKFQVSISMILAGVFRELTKRNLTEEYWKKHEHVATFAQEVSYILSESFLEDPDYKASSTNPVEIAKVVDRIVSKYEYSAS